MTEPDQHTRANRRRTIARLTRKTTLTASERSLLARLRRFDAADTQASADDATLRHTLGLAPDEMPAATRNR